MCYQSTTLSECWSGGRGSDIFLLLPICRGKSIDVVVAAKRWRRAANAIGCWRNYPESVLDAHYRADWGCWHRREAVPALLTGCTVNPILCKRKIRTGRVGLVSAARWLCLPVLQLLVPGPHEEEEGGGPGELWVRSCRFKECDNWRRCNQPNCPTVTRTAALETISGCRVRQLWSGTSNFMEFTETERHLLANFGIFPFEAQGVIESSRIQKKLIRASDGLSNDVHVHQIRFNGS